MHHRYIDTVRRLAAANWGQRETSQDAADKNRGDDPAPFKDGFFEEGDDKDGA